MMLTTTRRARLIPWIAAIAFLLPLAIPTLAQAAQTPVAEDADDAPAYSVTIRNWLCDSGGNFDTHDPEDLIANCATPFDGVRFRFSMFGVGETDAISQGGVIQFPIPDPNEVWSIQQQALDGFENPSVHCVALDADGMQVADLGTYEESRNNRTFASKDLHGGNQIRCDWHHIPDSTASTGEGTLTIFKWTCPEGYDPVAAEADPINDCGTGPNGVPFTLSDTSGAAADVVVETGAVQEDAASFPAVAPGAWTITEAAPARTSGYFVWQGCVDPPEASSPAFTPARPISDGASIEHHADGAARLCHWFNVPG